MHVLQMMEEGRSVVPRHLGGAGDDVVAVQRRDRDDREVRRLQLGREGGELVRDRLEDVLGPVDQVHLVHTQDEVRHPQERAEERVPPGLLHDALPGVDQDQGQVGRRGPGHHVARVLDVPGGVGDDELPARGREVPVRHVDRDALFPLGPQPIGQQSQIGVLVAARGADRLHRRELVLEDRLRVVEQPADERGLAVVDRPGGGEAQQVHRARRGGARVAVSARFVSARSVSACCVRRMSSTTRSSLPACGPPSRPR